MEYAIVLLVFLAIWHYTYENIILPTTHVRMRNKLFALRDELRELQRHDKEGRYAAELSIVEVGINNAIDLVGAWDLSLTVRMMRRYNADSAFRERIAERTEVINRSQCKELKDIRERANKVLNSVLVANTGGWYAYIIPVFAVAMCYTTIATIAKELFSLPETDASRYFAQRPLACAA